MTGPMDRRHTDRGYSEELEQLRQRLLFMGAKVEEAVDGAVRAMDLRDEILAARVIASDAHIDQLEMELDDRALLILARYQPVASDLRFITTVLKVVTHLERVGDLAEAICRNLRGLDFSGMMSRGSVLHRLAESASRMLRDALDAFVRDDASLARDVIKRDRFTDAYYAQLIPELVALMMGDPERVESASRLQSIGKALERVGDHATNIAEMVVFMVDGRNVRHIGRKSASGAAGDS
jgi:phosphate transport system protein